MADICVKALHDSTARNKSFDVGNIQFRFEISLSEMEDWILIVQVCYEYVAEQGRELYELVRNIQI